MKKEVNHAIRKRFNEVIYHVARYMEILLSVVILGVIALVGIRLVCDVTSREILSMNVDFLYGISCKCAVSCCWSGVCKNALQTFCSDRCGGSYVCNSKADGSRASENLGDADRSDRHWDFICDPQVSDDRSRRHGVP